MSQASNSRPGIASPVVMIKKLTQSIWSASQPPPDDRTVRPAAISEVSSAYRSEEHTSELQSLMRISYAVFCLKQKKIKEPEQELHYYNRPDELRKNI